jgi:hypothetical protein
MSVIGLGDGNMLRALTQRGAEPLLMAVVERDGSTTWIARANMADKHLEMLTKTFFEWKAKYKQARKAGLTGDQERIALP